MKNKNNKLRNIIWTISGILLMAILVLATTTITNTKVTTPNINISEYIYTNLTNGSVLYIKDGKITERNIAFYFEEDNGCGKLAVGCNAVMRNILQAVKDEGITDIDNIKGLIAVRNINTSDGTFAGVSMQTVDTGGDVYSGVRMLTNFTNHSVGNVSGDLLFDTRHLGTRSVKMKLSSIGNLNVTGNVTAENVHLSSYLSTHTNTSITAVEGDWLNITFDVHDDTENVRITHTYNDATNDTFTIVDTGVYKLSYKISFLDSEASPNNIVAIRIIKDGIEVIGSVFEKDTTKQNALGTICCGTITSLTAGDKIKMQFISNSTTVSIQTPATYGDHPASASININRIG